MVRMSKKDGEVEPKRMNPESSAGIYVTASAEAECHMIAHNQNMREGKKKITSKVNAFKKSARITKRGRSFAKLLEETSELYRDMNTSEDPSLLSLSTDTIKENFYRPGREIGEFYYQNKWTVTQDIVQKWGQSIMGSCACVF